MNSDLWTRDREVTSLREKIESLKKTLEQRRNDIANVKVGKSSAPFLD